jgi:hypothetical protein
MIDPRREKLIGLKDVPVAIGQMFESGKGPCYETIRRLARHGKNGVVLETLVVGRRTYTTREAIVRFFQALTEIEKSQPENTVTRRTTAAAREARSLITAEFGL